VMPLSLSNFLFGIAGIIVGGAVPLCIQKREWQHEKRKEALSLRLELKALHDEINQNFNRMNTMLGELKNNISPTFTLSTIQRNTVWHDLIRSEVIQSCESLFEGLNDLYYDFDHVNYKIRFIRDIIASERDISLSRAVEPAKTAAIVMIEKILKEKEQKKQKLLEELKRLREFFSGDRKALRKGKFIEKKRALVGILISSLGALILFSPNIGWINDFYDSTVFNSLTSGMKTLTGSQNVNLTDDDRRTERRLENNVRGFKEIRQIIIRHEKDIEKYNIEKITSKWAMGFEGSDGQHLEFVRLIYVHVPSVPSSSILVGTEGNLKTWVSIHRNIYIEGAGTLVVVIGAMFPYLWQAFCFIKER